MYAQAQFDDLTRSHRLHCSMVGVYGLDDFLRVELPGE